MSNFTSTFVFESDFDGDHVIVELQRLTNDQVNKLSPFFSKLDGGELKIRFADQMEIIGILGQILPGCVVRLEGLKDKAGNALTLDKIIGRVYFMALFQAWLGALLKHSFLSEDEGKKSEAQPAAAR